MPKKSNVDVVSFGGNLTPEQLLISTLELSQESEDDDQYDLIVIGVLTKGGQLFMGRSDGSALKCLGLLDWLMAQVRNRGLGSS